MPLGTLQLIHNILLNMGNLPRHWEAFGGLSRDMVKYIF
jgi:hypothetical protein